MQLTPQLKQYQKINEKVCKVFSRRLKKMRNNRCMTLNEIAEMLGISRQSVVYYEMGDRLPSVPILIRIAKLFSTSVDYTVAEITGIEENGLIIIYSDKHGERITKKVHIENTAKYSLGELLDIQICGKHFPSVFISPGISKT